MFTKKDYLEYFDELYEKEIGMKKEVEDLLKVVKDPKAVEILKNIHEDEIRHMHIVKNMKDLI